MANNMKGYMLIVIIVVLVFHLTGLLAESGSLNSTIMEAVLNPSILKTSAFYVEIFAIITLITAAGILVGIFSRPPAFVYFVGMFAIFTAIGWDLIGVFLVLNNVNTPLALLSVSPLLILYILSALEWVRGM